MPALSKLPSQWVSLARSQFSGFAIGDGALGTAVRKLSATPKTVRAAAAQVRAQGGKPLVYRVKLATVKEQKERLAYAVFDKSNERARPLVFGPDGEALGKVRQHKASENPWSEA